MQTPLKFRLFVIFGLLLVALYALYPSIVYFSLNESDLREVRKNRENFKKFIPSWSSESHIVPGLDLQGGIHMVLGVDLNKAITDKTSRTTDRLIDYAKKEGVIISDVKQVGESIDLKNKVVLSFDSSSDMQNFKQNILPKFYDFSLSNVVSENSLELKLEQNLENTIRGDAVNQTIKTIINRIDKMGVTEPSISKRGEDQVQVQLAGYDDANEAKLLLGRTAQLQFQMCDDEADFLTKLSDLPAEVKLIESRYQSAQGKSGKDIYLQFPDYKLAEIKEYLADKVPNQNTIRFGEERRDAQTMRTYTLKKKVELTGDDLVDARVSQGSQMNPQPGVSLSFNSGAAKIFADITENSIGKRMAIVLEDIVDSAPVISTKIPDGNAFISMGGARTQTEMLKDANSLALVLKSGALPAPVTFREERSVGPSLGKDSIEQGKIAFAIGGALIFLFMLFYYRGAGFISLLGVIFNLTFVVAALSFLGATVTLPGVAALLLTVGMAVDANIIINERIREELRLGKMPRSAVKSGYDSAFSAIVDSNFTTFIAGLVLWQFGTGPVQNFATMLLIGTTSSVFCAIYVTRIFFDLQVRQGKETLSI